MEAKDPIVAMREAHTHAQNMNRRARAATTTLRDLLTPEEWAELKAAQIKAAPPKPEHKH